MNVWKVVYPYIFYIRAFTEKEAKYKAVKQTRSVKIKLKSIKK